MSIVFELFKIVVGFILLIKGADFFVDGASAVAKKLGVPELVIGLTIVAFGTSAPEAAVSLSAALRGNNGISIGNVIGSNIMNVLLILGLTAIITSLKVKRATVRVDIPVVIGSTILMVFWGLVGGKLTRLTGIIFLLILIGYMVYLFWYSKHAEDEDEGDEIKDLRTWTIPLYLLGGLAAIIFGSDVTVDGATEVAKVFGVSDRLIGLTIVAFGTSLPELVTSVTAARKGSADIAIGNIVGSNLFNILFILGMTSVMIDLPYMAQGANFLVDGFVALYAIFLLFILVVKNKELGRKGGILMLISYAGYFAYLLINK
ncbi:MAG: calcium/sodium antiporter [Eubacterium sp.]|nr:calcium/sodium antiporter [Eubacterium sp.]